MVKMEDKRKAGQMQAPDPWIKRHIDLFPEGGKVLDLAAGAGRHTLLSIALGHPVVAVDRDTSRLKKAASGNPDIRQHDLEARAWPWKASGFTGSLSAIIFGARCFLRLLQRWNPAASCSGPHSPLATKSTVAREIRSFCCGATS